MEHFFSAWHGKSNNRNEDGDNRLLRKLKIVLLFWLVCFIATLIWFTNSPAF